MHHFFSRRSFNAQKGRFTDNPADVTRYVAVTSTTGPVSKGHLMPCEDWVDAVRASSASGHVMIYVHGFNTSQAEFLGRLKRIKGGLAGAGWTGAVVGFDWPSDGEVLAYGSDRADARKVGRFLAVDGIGPLLKALKPGRLHLLAHSMGAYLTIRGFSEVGDSGGPGAVPWSVREMVFVAADIEQKWLDKGASGALVAEKRSARLTHYHSGEDKVLDLSGKIINIGSKRSGRHGIRPAKPDGFHDIDCAARYLARTPPVKRTTIHSHNWYYEDPAFYADLAATLDGQDALTIPTRGAPDADGDQSLL